VSSLASAVKVLSTSEEDEITQVDGSDEVDSKEEEEAAEEAEAEEAEIWVEDDGEGRELERGL